MPSSSNKEQAFLNRLTEIVEANLTNDQFGVSELAHKFGKSRSYIHRQLKSITNESVSHFICTVRLEKAMEMLQHNEASVAEIAYEVGFGSPSYFIKCFHEYFGYSPGEYVKNESEINLIHKKGIVANDDIRKEQRLHGRKWLIMVSILFFVALTIFMNKYFFDQAEHSNLEKSIAVLSLKNLSNDTEIPHLADGIMEDIRTRLSYISGLEVKSQISSDKYGDTKLSAREIAKELGVSYILEGSIIPDKGKIRINIQLISAKKDDHKWAYTFDKDLTGILEFITDVSKQVTEKLKVVLSAEEIKQVEKIYTENTEAYSLYQKGRFFWHRRTEEGLNESVEYFNQALKLDSTYALAYAGLADAYFILAFWGWYPHAEGLSKGKEYAFKALNLDNDLAEAHTTLGGIASFQANWEVAEKELKHAIKLNPNYATAHLYYSEYFYAVGTIDEARKHIDLAIELNPNSIIMYAFSSRLCYYDGDYIESLKKGDKVLEINKNFRENNWIRFKSFIRLKKDSDAIDVLHKVLSRDISGINYKDTLLNIYSESGINGILFWEINRQLNGENPRYHRIAGFYSLAGEKEKAMDCLEKTYEEGRSFLLFRMNSDPDFFILHDEPRFKALLEKMNLTLE